MVVIVGNLEGGLYELPPFVLMADVMIDDEFNVGLVLKMVD